MRNNWARIAFSFIGLIVVCFVIDSCLDIRDDMRNAYLDRQYIKESPSPPGPDIRYCLKADYDDDLWDCIRNGEYRKQMFRTDI